MEDELTNYKIYKPKTFIYNIFLFNTTSNIKNTKKKYGLLDINYYLIKKEFIINNYSFNLQYNTINNITKELLPFLDKNINYKICVLKNYKNVCFISILLKNIVKLHKIIDTNFINKNIVFNYKKTLFFDVKKCFYKKNSDNNINNNKLTNYNLIKGLIDCNINKTYFNEKLKINKQFKLSLFEILKKIKPYYWIIK